MNHKRTFAGAIISSGMAMGLVGCGSTPSGGPAIGSQAAAFQATTASGESFDLSDKRGSIIVLDFYTNW